MHESQKLSGIDPMISYIFSAFGYYSHVATIFHGTYGWSIKSAKV